MYSNRFSLPFVSQLLISAAERVRPGLGPWSPAVRSRLEEVFRAELSEVKARFCELFDDPPYWEKLEAQLLGVCFPRYAAVSEKATGEELRDYGIWRGGDLIARGAWALGGFALGIFLVKAPFIPVPETWDLLAFALLLGAPFIPDAQLWFAQRQHRKELERVIDDMREAHEQQRLYEPLRALHDTLRSDPIAPTTDPLAAGPSGEPASPGASLPGRERTR